MSTKTTQQDTQQVISDEPVRIEVVTDRETPQKVRAAMAWHWNQEHLIDEKQPENKHVYEATFRLVSTEPLTIEDQARLSEYLAIMLVPYKMQLQTPGNHVQLRLLD